MYFHTHLWDYLTIHSHLVLSQYIVSDNSSLAGVFFFFAESGIHIKHDDLSS